MPASTLRLRRLRALLVWLGWTMRGELVPRLREWRRLREDAGAIAGSGLLDAAWYARTYPDVFAPNAARHYVAQGALEGRSPGPGFDGPGYLAKNPDVALAGTNPLLHYVRQGRAEGRPVSPANTCLGALRRPDDTGYAAWLAEAGDMPATGPFCRLPKASVAVVAAVDLSRAIASQDADWTLVLAAHVRLAPAAVPLIATEAARSPDRDAITADEDRIDAYGRRTAPRFKPHWDPDLLLATGYVGAGVAVRTGLLRRIVDDGVATMQDLLLRLHAAIGPERAGHLPVVLFHAAAPLPWPAEPVRAHLAGQAAVLTAPAAGLPLRIRRPLPATAPRVSVLVPTRDQPNLLARCLRGLLERTDYPSLEVLVIDNGSTHSATARLLRRAARDPRVRVLRDESPFDWCALNNRAAAEARGELLLLLNNDVFAREPGWLAEMAAEAVRPEIGAVGATLLYPDGRLQHAGVALHDAGLAAHVSRFAPGGDTGLGVNLGAVRSVAAVTGACLMLRRETFEAVGGLAEGHLPVTYNDVDLCLRVRALGLRVICTPHARLTHVEGVSRGPDTSPDRVARRFREWSWMRARWGGWLSHDPYLNANLAIMREQPMLAARPAWHAYYEG